MISKIKSGIKNEYVFSVLTKLIMVAIGIMHSVLLARYLGASLKGQISYIQSILSVGSIVLTMGMHHAYTYYRKRSTDNRFISSFMNSVILVFAVFCVIGGICCVVIHGKYLEVAIAAILMPLWGYTRVVSTVFIVENPNKRNLTVLILSILEIVFLVSLYIFTSSTLMLGVTAIGFIELSQAIVFTVLIKFNISASFISMKLVWQLMSYGFLPMISLLMSTLNYRIDIFMLKGAGSVTLAEIGVYSIGIALAEKALLIPDAVKEILLSKLTKGKTGEEVAIVSRIAFVVSVIVAIFIIIVGKPFISLLYGEEYDGAYLVTVISVFGTVFMVFFKMICQYNIVNKKQSTNACLLAISILVNIIMNILLIPIAGIIGAAIATVIGHVVSAIAFVLKFSNDTGIPVKQIVLIQNNDLQMVKGFVNK